MHAMSTTPDLASMRRELLEHFDAHRRELPWRESTDPYRVWVSEIMLQQTRVQTAAPYYLRWMERFPSVAELALADEEAVLKAWEGLGYYSRARNLHRSARVVREQLNGVLPDNSSGLRGLPGIGEYSAGAIASIAYGEATPAVDGNARRVISRLFDLASPSAAELREKAKAILDRRRPGDWNQAIMELGATICLPRSPRCGECPIAEHCRARSLGTQEMRPLAEHRPRVREASFAVLVAVGDGGELFLTRRASKGLLGGLWDFPSVEFEIPDDLDQACRRLAETWSLELPPSGSRWRPLQNVRHAFTHLRALYRPMLVCDATGGPVSEVHESPAGEVAAVGPACHWATSDEASELPLPVAQRKILGLALAELAKPDAESLGPHAGSPVELAQSRATR